MRITVFALAAALFAQAPKPAIPVNYDESQVGSYMLPDPLTLANGKKVRDTKTWMNQRRPEILELFRTNQHGRSPGRPEHMTFDVFDKGTPALGGKAIRRQVEIRFDQDRKFDLLVYLPAGAKKPSPMLLQIAFNANSTTIDDPGIRPGMVWTRDTHQRIPAKKPGMFPPISIDDWLAKGFGFATFYYGDVEPDFNGAANIGVRGLYFKPGQTEPEPDGWGAIGAWAWGMSRAMDYLESDPGVDAKRVAIMGLSRLGKTALWAGAQDTRFAAVISSCSGEGGAALSRRWYGETVKHLNTSFPHWFCLNYRKYNEHVDQLPVDANMLLSLVAPRPLYVSSGDEDKWADPKGEFLAASAVDPVYKLFGKHGLGTDQMPASDSPIMHDVGYHVHTGGHGTTAYDWQQYLKFLTMHLRP